jgi:tetratricopeptide (TPR) repeat protein
MGWMFPWRVALAAGLLLSWAAAPAPALPDREKGNLSPFQQRGADVGMALLVEYYNELPDARENESRTARAARQKALEAFKRKVSARYTEGTLERLLDSGNARARQAAVLALGMLGTMRSNQALAALLRDDNRQVRHLAADALWSLWFRASTEANNQELQRLIRLSDPEKTLAGLNDLLEKAPDFAEAYNQRAIVHFRLEEYQKSVADCAKVVKLNPCHFGAQSGMAQGYMKLKKPRAALRAFRNAFRINPELQGVEETIRALEDVLGEEGKK